MVSTEAPRAFFGQTPSQYVRESYMAEEVGVMASVASHVGHPKSPSKLL